MPERMTKQDVIEYLLYMKHDVQAKSSIDIALDTAIEALKQPTIEAEPVRHGRWIAHDVIENMKCSECGEEYRMPFDFNANVYPYNFCPNCGARMDGGADNG